MYDMMCRYAAYTHACKTINYQEKKCLRDPRPPPAPPSSLVPRLENRQRHKIEEQEADLTRLKSEMASLKRDHNRVLAENGRLSDASGELQSQLQSVSLFLSHWVFCSAPQLVLCGCFVRFGSARFGSARRGSRRHLMWCVIG